MDKTARLDLNALLEEARDSLNSLNHLGLLLREFAKSCRAAAPNLSGLVDWLAKRSDDLSQQAHGRREMAKTMRGATKQDLAAGLALAEKMHGGKLQGVSTDPKSAEECADRDDRIAAKLEAEAHQLDLWIIALKQEQTPEDVALRAATRIAALATSTHGGCSTIDILRANISRLGAEVIREALYKRLAAQANPAEYYWPDGSLGWTNPHDVGHLILQLQTLDPRMKVSSVAFINMEEGPKARAFGLSMSREKWDDAGWLNWKLDRPECLAIWARVRDDVPGLAPINPWNKIEDGEPNVGQLVHLVVNGKMQHMPARLSLLGFGGCEGKEWDWLDESADPMPFEKATHWQYLPTYP